MLAVTAGDRTGHPCGHRGTLLPISTSSSFTRSRNTAKPPAKNLRLNNLKALSAETINSQSTQYQSQYISKNHTWKNSKNQNDSVLCPTAMLMIRKVPADGHVFPYRLRRWWICSASWAAQRRFPSASAATWRHRKDAQRGSVRSPPATQAWRSSETQGETKAEKNVKWRDFVWLGGSMMIYNDL